MTHSYDIQPLLTADLGSPIRQMQAAPICLGAGAPRALMLAYAADFDVDPYIEMFFFPKDTRKIVVIDDTGRELWRRDLGPSVVPGTWFCPVYVCDLDADGVDEVYFVNNLDALHPLGLSSYVLERLDGRTGETTGQWPWPQHLKGKGTLSLTFRHFILGGQVRGEQVLVTAQGTYGDMCFQAFGAGMAPRWEKIVSADAPGARGSHMCAISDMDGDGDQEVLWGERCLSLDDGRELFCADRDTYGGHSDVAQPVIDRQSGRRYLYTCRESETGVPPRVCLYDAQGRRLWGHVDEGHVDMGWVARLAPHGRLTAMAIRIGHKTCGPEGRFHMGRGEYTIDLLTGEPVDLPYSVYGTLPVDFSGDGRQELVRGLWGQKGQVLTGAGEVVGDIGGPVALLGKLLDHPGEQALAVHRDGVVRVLGDRNAEDSDAALARYADPLYLANQRVSASGYNVINLAGL